MSYPEDYSPPTWHKGYDNSHLIEMSDIEMSDEGVIRPKAVYQAYADKVNRDLERQKINQRLVWDEITSSFSLRPIAE